MRVSQQTCTFCIMDTSAPDIVFDSSGRCNYCSTFEATLSKQEMFVSDDARRRRLVDLVERVKSNGTGKDYDCIVGVSGGVDSSWALVQAVRLGLRPLAVHMDNGWNSELAVSNIANLVEGLGVDLYTYVIDWPEYRALMQAFFDADVIDVELLYDNAMLAVTHEQAAKYRLKNILSGSNLSTEGLRMPMAWAWKDKWDATNIVAIGKSRGVRVSSFPLFSNLRWLGHNYVRGTRWVPFLDFLDYKKDEALAELVSSFGYKPYPYKHYESVFTRFYQGYILPEKFGVDKRRVHLSSLVVTRQLTRERALEMVSHSPYPDPDDLERDKTYFLKKMGWSEQDLAAYLERPARPHEDWRTDPIRPLLELIYRTRNRLRSATR